MHHHASRAGQIRIRGAQRKVAGDVHLEIRAATRGRCGTVRRRRNRDAPDGLRGASGIDLQDKSSVEGVI